MRGQNVDFDCGRGANGRQRMAITLFDPGPNEMTGPRRLLVCLPGGTYSRRYWDLSPVGGACYSFAATLAQSGFWVASMDPLGTGDSDHPPAGGEVNFDVITGAHVDAVRQLRLYISSPGTNGGPVVIGVGHSLGAALLVHHQAQRPTFDGLVLLGYSPAHNPLSVPAQSNRPAHSVTGLRQDVLAAFQMERPALWHQQYLSFPRPSPREAALAGPDGAALRAVDDSLCTELPRGAAVDFACKSLTEQAAAQVDIPVLVGFGRSEVGGDTEREWASYQRCPEVTIKVFEEMGHLHNFAPGRAQLWADITAWASRTEARS